MGHTLAGTLYLRAFYRPLGRPTLFTVGTVDQHPKSLACALLFGHQYTVPVPDIDRTSHLLVIGANPLVSNGSLLAAPDIRSRIQGVRQRGGKVVVVDPRRTETARERGRAPLHPPGRRRAPPRRARAHAASRRGSPCPAGSTPSSMASTTCARSSPRSRPSGSPPRAASPPRRSAASRASSPPRRQPRCTAASARRPRRSGRRRAGSSRCSTSSPATSTARVGRCSPRRPRAAPPTRARPGRGKGIEVGRWHSRVRGAPEVLGELPLACLAEEIETPGEGRIRALVTFSGNPALSNPDPGRLEAALQSLDCLVCVDLYLNETTRHAHVILPSPSPLERAHYDVMVYPTALRNIANYSPPVLPAGTGTPRRVGDRAAPGGHRLRPRADRRHRGARRRARPRLVARAARTEGSPIEGRDPDEILAVLGEEPGPERLLDASLRLGPYGDGFGARPGGLTLDVLRATPHGIDFGPLVPRLPEALRTPCWQGRAGPPALPRRPGASGGGDRRPRA